MLSAALVLVPAYVSAEEAKLVALQFHSDHCGSCQVLEPALLEARKELAEAPILFVKLDHTDDATTRQAKMLVEALEVEDIYNGQKKSSGFVLLVDPEKGKTLGKLTKTNSAAQMKEQIERALKS